MPITSITIENFKGIRDKVKIDLKPITLLFGPNSAGKSTIIQALQYAWEVIGRHNLDPNFTEFGGREIDLGGFQNLVYGHDLSRSISIRLDIDMKGKVLPQHIGDPSLWVYYEAAGDFGEDNIFCWNVYKGHTAWIELQIAWNQKNRKPYISRYEVGLNNELIATVKTSLEDNKVYISYINFFHQLLCLRNPNQIEEAFKKILSEDYKKPSWENYDRVYYFKDLIDEAYENPESWLDPKIFPPDEYNKFAQLVSSFKEIEESEEFKKFREKEGRNFIDAIDDVELYTSEEGKKKLKENLLQLIQSNKLSLGYNIKNYMKDKHNLSSDYDFYSPFIPYEFLFFCLDKLPLESLSQDFKIGLDQADALPTWDRDDFLSIDIATSEDNHIGGYTTAICSALTQIIVGPGQLIKDELEKLRYLGPIRSRIPRNYVPNRFVDWRNWPDGLAAWDVLHKNEDEEIVKQTDFWMADRLKSGYHITRKTYKEIDVLQLSQEPVDIQAIYNATPVKTRLYLLDQKSGVEVQPPDVGVGISQVIPVIVSALYFKEGIVSIEQPELHIHPALQVTLGDLFISQIQDKGPCFILETHSEHLMLRFLRRIRETSEGNLSADNSALTPDQLAIYYIEPGENGMTVSQIRVDQDGEFMDRWPRGFFAERAKELL